MQSMYSECTDVSLYSDAFPCEQQFNIVSKYIVDQTQTANVKVSHSTSVSVSLCLWVVSKYEGRPINKLQNSCLLYTSDAADE